MSKTNFKQPSRGLIQRIRYEKIYSHARRLYTELEFVGRDKTTQGARLKYIMRECEKKLRNNQY